MPGDNWIDVKWICMMCAWLYLVDIRLSCDVIVFPNIILHMTFVVLWGNIGCIAGYPVNPKKEDSIDTLLKELHNTSVSSTELVFILFTIIAIVLYTLFFNQLLYLQKQSTFKCICNQGARWLVNLTWWFQSWREW